MRSGYWREVWPFSSISFILSGGVAPLGDSSRCLKLSLKRSPTWRHGAGANHCRACRCPTDRNSFSIGPGSSRTNRTCVVQFCPGIHFITFHLRSCPFLAPLPGRRVSDSRRRGCAPASPIIPALLRVQLIDPPLLVGMDADQAGGFQGLEMLRNGRGASSKRLAISPEDKAPRPAFRQCAGGWGQERVKA